MNEYQADRSMNAASNATRSFESENDIALQCPTCTFATSNRSKFIDHLINYCTSKRNNDSTTLKAANLPVSPVLEYLEGNDKCSPTTREEYTGCKTKEINEPNVHECNVISRVDSRDAEGMQEGREKYRENKSCKQCSFVTNTKMEYWEHMRCHIKGFTCSECSFVTKYKHHMNHHWLSVHDGSKPFKCKKCSYTCVSKSMLTSHQKKHSNVYPYRCANCNYKTKFCNALKKHLRKKEHRPAMVLNADGSPNPLFVIDVYGTKRGPKQKLSTDKRDELNRNTDVTIADNDNRTTTGSAGPICPVISSLESPPVARYPTATAMNGANDANYEINQNGRNKKNRSVVTFPYSDLVAAFNLSSHLSLPEDATLDTQDTPRTDTLIEYAEIKTNVQENNRMTETQTFVQNPRVTFFDTSDTINDESGILDRDVKAISESSVLVALKSQLGMSQRNEFMDTPLDLRIAEAMEKNRLEFQLLATSSPKTIGTSKRKGRAIKLERRRVTFEEDADEKPERNQVVEPSSLDRRGAIERKSDVEKEIEEARGRKAVNDSVDIEFVCHYCEIMFGNVVMYTVHMGCHGFDDPFTCNMCGHQCIDKLSFFLHIAKSEHM